jgi:phytoene dehydrogenase-like protein
MDDRRTNPEPAGPTTTDRDVVVVGGGLAGLTAAVTAARAGASVTLLDAHPLGGRARTTTVDPGVVFNGGAHAFYLGGAGAAILADLGIDPSGGIPDSAHGAALRDGRLHPLPGGPLTLLRTRLLSPRSKLAVARLLARLQRLDPTVLADRSVRQWMDDLGLAPDARLLLQMLIRTAAYTADIEDFSADAALTQVQLALGAGVRYVDRGFQQLVDALAARAEREGVEVHHHAPVTGIVASTRPGARWDVATATGVRSAAAVVLASGGPDAARSLSPVPLELAGLTEPVTAACLELAVAGPIAQPIVLGVGEPLYLSVHQPPADLAPAGTSVVHGMRYGARSSTEDRADLWRLARIGGITEDRVVAQRFLRRMVVMGGLPRAATGGLPGRPAVRAPGVAGLTLAGDWVGPVGLLTDASVASGREAGLAAAAARISGDRDRVGTAG